MTGTETARISSTEVADPCLACGKTEVVRLFRAGDRLYHTTDKVFSVVECRGCRLMRLWPQPTPTELDQYYPKNYWYVPEADAAASLEQMYRRLVLHDHVRFVRRAVEESGQTGFILDVGCGGGLFLKMLRDEGFKVAGLDFSIDAAGIAWGKNGVPALCGTLAHSPFRREQCSAITMFHVLEHLYDPVSYLEAAFELLRPNGRLVVQVPNAACWQFLLFGENWNGIDVPRHLFHYRRPDLEILLDRCGFEILRCKYFSLRDNPAGFATSMAPGLDPMARRIRHIPETPGMKLWKDLLYFGLVAGSMPFTMLEAACHAGSTIMLEARKRR